MANILVVEDDKINAKLFELVLTRVGGFAVTVTEDADEVIRIASEGQADLILMDVSLSNTEYEGVPVDGIELTRILKQDARTSSIPVVLTTAHALRGDRERFLQQSGADGYVSKPIEDNRALVSLVQGLLNSSEAQLSKAA
ncbi:MAG: response regulator [Armatimonadota bacterium]|jgi:CheY-like chemotaxis protein|nr:MAG: response regulator [Armatimonadota bacterium]